MGLELNATERVLYGQLKNSRDCSFKFVWAGPVMEWVRTAEERVIIAITCDSEDTAGEL